MASQYFQGLFSALTSKACTFDTTPPTFAGITSATPNSDGSTTVSWALATSKKTPVDYHVYIALGSVSAATLFQQSNVTIHVPPGKTSGRVFLMPDQATYLVKDQVYTVGVRANDAQGYEDSNTAIQVVTAIASGNLAAVFQTIANQMAATEVLLAADHVAFQGDHTNFQADHVNFQSDHADFVAALATLASDITDLEASVALIDTSAASIDASATTLNAVAVSLSASLNTLNAVLPDIVDAAASLAISAPSIATSASSLSSSATSLASSVTTLAGQLTTLAADLTTLSGYLAQLGTDVAAINALVATLNTLIASLLSAVVPATINGSVEGTIVIEGSVESEEII